MKFSMCTTWAKDKMLEEVVETAKSLNLHGIEIWDGHIDEYLVRTGSTLSELKEFLDEKGIKCCAVAPYLKFLNNEEIQSGLKTAEKCVIYARALGAKLIRTFVGNRPSKDLSKEQWEGCVSALKTIVTMVEKEDICFALETHNNQPTDTPEAVLNIIEWTGSEKLKVIFDGYNYIYDKIDMMEAYGKLRDYIVHYHVKNYNNSGKRTPAPLQSGDVNFEHLIKYLIKSEYEDFISFEYLGVQPDQYIKESIGWINELKSKNI